MAGKISSLSGSSAPIGAGHRANKARDAASDASDGVSAAGTAGDGDVQITSSASLLASLEQQLQSMPAVDEQRVATYRTAIENGSYSVQPQHVADQMLQIEHALAQAAGG